jgi:hypothetical protein
MTPESKCQYDRRQIKWGTNKALGMYVKGEAIPLQDFTSHEGSRGLRLPDFKTIGT